MEESKTKLFISQELEKDISENDMSKIELIIKTVAAFNKLTYQHIGVVDIFNNSLIYISDNTYNIQKSTLFTSNECSILSQYISSDEQNLLHEIYDKYLEKIHELSINERMEYSLKFDFHLDKKKKKPLLHFTTTPLYITKKGEIGLALYTISISTRRHFGHVILAKIPSYEYFQYSFENHKWEHKYKKPLNTTEKQIIIHSAEGYTMGEIAEKLYISINTVKAHKRRIFNKLDVNSISAAITSVINYI